MQGVRGDDATGNADDHRAEGYESTKEDPANADRLLGSSQRGAHGREARRLRRASTAGRGR